MTPIDAVERNGLTIEEPLFRFVSEEVLPGLPVDADAVWGGLAKLVDEVGPRIVEALATRERLQADLDRLHRDEEAGAEDPGSYRKHLEEIGYLVPEGSDFAIETAGIDAEISDLAGPQLVVPGSNARFALNAANSRWGSLYDAVYGTDVLGDPPATAEYDPARGKLVVAWVRQFLDDVLPLSEGSHAAATAYRIVDGRLAVSLDRGATVGLARPDALRGHAGPATDPESILLENNGLGIVLVIDRESPVGRADAAGVSDVVIEAALTTIIDLEDSVAAVDTEDKVAAYRNWLGLMRGDLTAWVSKDGGGFERKLAPDKHFVDLGGTEIRRRGRSLLLVRNVGHLMTTPAVRDSSGQEISEGLLDALLTVLIAMHDFERPAAQRNSPAGSVYVVKPKLHGPEEVAIAGDAFTLVEEALGLPADTVKLGVMDEERRTSVNLKACIRASRRRLAFINTGFLDRTGDEIHTSMQAGPMVRKAAMRSSAWIEAYENRNVAIGLACGLRGKAQIGKGMWAAPDNMREMLEQKIGHPRAGANCAWVPSPTAATLHATHYHRVDVAAVQAELAAAEPADELDALLSIPVADDPGWDDATRQEELDNNAQGILGYVVRWVDQGIGCSKVPDIHDVPLMEDRATCRISSQHIANWLRHGVLTPEEVTAGLRRMAVVVDGQNADDPSYTPMAPSFDGEAFAAATALVFEGAEQPSGYTEPILHRHRARRKQALEGSEP